MSVPKIILDRSVKYSSNLQNNIFLFHSYAYISVLAFVSIMICYFITSIVLLIWTTLFCTVISFHVSSTIYACFTPNCTGGGGPRRPPPEIFCRAHLTAAPRATRFHDFFLWSLAHILTPSLRKSDHPLWSHMTFCDQRSTRKVRFVSILCTKPMAKCYFSFLAINHYIFLFWLCT